MPRTPSRVRRRRLRPIALTVAVFALLALGTSTALGLRRGPTEVSRRSDAGGPRPSTAASPHRSPGESVPAEFPHAGPGTWRYAWTTGPVYGTAGPVRRYRVAVESGIPYELAAFAAKVDAVLGDPRGWTAGGQFRLQQVPGNAPAQFTVYLATRQTTTTMCLAGGLHTNGYTSCQTPAHVIINLDRWFDAVPEYVRAGVPLDVYREYVINHEIGHQLGHGHELCPGPGRPAPVMEQQTLGLHGCTANAWPYLGGERYVGPPGQY